MKKLVLGAFTMFFLASALISCNSGKSDEQIAKEAQEMFDKEKETLTQQASAECDKVVQTKLDSIRTAKAEEKEDPKKKDK
jgi:NCAIR mutase (PurE)-related protein